MRQKRKETETTMRSKTSTSFQKSLEDSKAWLDFLTTHEKRLLPPVNLSSPDFLFPPSIRPKAKSGRMSSLWASITKFFHTSAASFKKNDGSSTWLAQGPRRRSRSLFSGRRQFSLKTCIPPKCRMRMIDNPSPDSKDSKGCSKD